MTLSEVMIASVLLTFVIMTGLTALSQAYRYVHHARMTTLASQILQSIVEDLRLRNYGQLKVNAALAQPLDVTSVLSTERFSSNFTTGFTVSALYTTLVASGPSQPGKLSVQLTVRWTEQGNVFTRSTLCYFGEQGLSDYIYVGWAP